LVPKVSAQNKIGCFNAFIRGTRFFSFAFALLFAAADFACAQTQATSAPSAQSPQAQARAADPPQATAAALATQPTKPAKASKPLEPCDIENTGASVTATGAMRILWASGFDRRANAQGMSPVETKVCLNHGSVVNWYARFVTGPDVMPFSPVQKLRLAVDNITDPFNLLTITGEAAISIASNSHTAYGPGFPGWGRNVGVSFTQDMTGQFFGTFLIPAITHTDPHYHRRPDLSIPHRILHCVDQIFWQRADNGSHTFNYSQLVGPIIDMSLSNLYVPGQSTRFSADAERYGVDLATAPIDNFITEFVPSIAAHIHTHVVFMQRIVNEVATTGKVP
jgi:hypothetical protein